MNFGRGIRIYINNEKFGKLQNGEIRTFEINSGLNEIYALKGSNLAFGFTLRYYLLKRSEFLYLRAID